MSWPRGISQSPYVLAQSAIPFILAGGTGGAGTQFTISATGALSTLPTLPITSGNAFVYMPTATVPGLTGGWYYALIQSATTAQLYTATYTSGDPRLAVPASPVAPTGITAGSYSQTTGVDITSTQITLPGGSMGPNGSLRSATSVSHTAATTQNVYALNFGTSGFVIWGNALAVNTPNTGVVNHQLTTYNVNSASRQYCASYLQDTGGGANNTPTTGSVNTANDVNLQNQLRIGAAGNFVIQHAIRHEVMYGA